MSVVFDKLKELAEIDAKLVSLKRRVDAGPKELEMQQQNCDAVKVSRSEVQEACMRCAAQIDALGLDVKSLEGETRDLDQKIGIVKNSKEYKIVTERIKDVKKSISDNEQKELELMEELDGLKTILTEKNEQLVVEEEKLEEVQSSNKSDAKLIKTEQIELIKRRKAKIAEIEAKDVDVMKIYNHSLSRGKGYALSELKNSACQMCFRKVSASVVNVVIAHINIDKCLCPGCGRILFVVNEE